MTKKKAVIILTVLVIGLVAVFAAACVEPMTLNDALACLADTSSSVAIPSVTVTVTEASNSQVIYSYPEPATNVPDEIAGIVTSLVPDLNGASSFSYDSGYFSDAELVVNGSVATYTAQISDMESFLGRDGDYADANIVATIDTEAMRALTVDVTYTFEGEANDFIIVVKTEYKLLTE